jgi:hypothetical protein
MRFKTIAILAAFCIALAMPSLATAQTPLNIAFNIGPGGYECANFSPITFYCYGIPVYVTNADDSKSYGAIWIDTPYFVQLGGFENLGAAFHPVITNESTGPYTGITTITVSGPETGWVPNPNEPSPPYTLVLHIVYTIVRQTPPCGRAGCRTNGFIEPSSTISVVYN